MKTAQNINMWPMPEAKIRKNPALIERLQLALDHAITSGLVNSMSDASKKVGSRNFIERIIKGHTYQPGNENLKALALALGVNFPWLAEGTGEMLNNAVPLDSRPYFSVGDFLNIVKTANAAILKKKDDIGVLDPDQKGAIYRALIETYQDGEDIDEGKALAVINAKHPKKSR